MTDRTVLIREYRPEDRPAAMALAPRLQVGVASWRDAEAVRTAVTGWVRSSLDAPTSEDRAAFVAVDDGDLVGLVTLGQRRHFAGEVDAYIGELMVAEGRERRGIGALLVRAAEGWARDRGLARLTLETGAANHTARAFYAALGFEEEEVRLTRTLSVPPT